MSNIQFYVDHASFNEVHGWAYDFTKNDFPDKFEIWDNLGNQIPIPETCLVKREDVTEAKGIEADRQCGFAIRLFDVFNRSASDFGIALNGKLQWSFSDYLSGIIDAEEKSSEPEYPKEAGPRQVLIVTEPTGTLHKATKTLLNWQSNVLSKIYCGGVSFYFIQFDQLSEEIIETVLSRQFLILLTDKECFPKIYQNAEEMVSKSSVIILDQHIELKDEWGGLINSLANVSGISDQTPLNAVLLYRMISGLSLYPEMFFPAHENLFTLQGGDPEPWMQDVMKSRVQIQEDSDFIILADENIERLSDLNHHSNAIFVNLRAIRFVYDLMKEDSILFVTRALARGLKYKIITKSQDDTCYI